MNSAVVSLYKSQRSRRFVAALLLAALAAHSLAWFVVTGWIIAEIPAFRANAAANGWTLDGGPPERAGWPFAAAVRVPHPVVSNAALRWSADAIDIAISPLDPAAVHLSPLGAYTLEANHAVIPLQATGLTLRAPLAGDAPWSVFATRISLRMLHVEGLAARITPLGVEVTALTITSGLPPPFQAAITLRGTLMLSQPIALDADAAAASAWRAAGGEARLTDLDLRWGKVHATGHGQLHLDEALQPTAETQLRIEGAGTLVDAFEQEGFIAPGAARAVRAVVAVQALGSVDGAFTLPIRLQGGLVTVMQFPTLRLDRLQWVRP